MLIKSLKLNTLDRNKHVQIEIYIAGNVGDADLSSFGNLDAGQELGHLQKRFFLSAAALFV